MRMSSSPSLYIRGHRFQKLQQLTTNMGQSLLQDTGFFKVASAPLASFLLVNMRTMIAKQSAEKAKNSGSEDEAHFAEVEALKTVVRERGGVISSFGLMALFNIAMDRPSQLAFGVEVKKNGVVGPVQYVSQALQLLMGVDVPVERPPLALGSQNVMLVNETPNAFQRIGQAFLKKSLVFNPSRVLQQATQEMGALSLKQQHEVLVKAGMANWRNIAVPLMGMGIAMGVAGWVLERTTLLRFEKIINRIQHLRTLAKASLTRHPKTEPFVPTLPQEESPTVVAPDPIEQQAAWISPSDLASRTGTTLAYSRYYNSRSPLSNSVRL